MNADRISPTLEDLCPSAIWHTLKGRLTEVRRQRLESAASGRTNYLRLVVQDVHQPHNISACLRSAEAFGIGNIDIVTLGRPSKVSSVARGVGDWLTINRYETVQSCAENLRTKGFKIAAGLPRAEATTLAQVPVDEPLAVVFGNEHAGIDSSWHELIDYPFTIPMSGLVESLNISVSAAISLYNLTERCKATVGSSYFLTKIEQERLLGQWLKIKVPSWRGEYGKLRTSRVIDDYR